MPAMTHVSDTYLLTTLTTLTMEVDSNNPQEIPSDINASNFNGNTYSSVPGNGVGLAPQEGDTNQAAQDFGWFEVFILLCSSFGAVGNCLNLLVLTRRRMMAGLDKLGRTANYGLIALAMSDFLFCCAVLPGSFATENVEGHSMMKAFYYFYAIYGVGCIQLFTMTSTWLIVMLAIKRLLVVKEPLRARGHLTCRRTILSIVLVIIASILWTLPYFLFWRVVFDADLGEYTVGSQLSLPVQTAMIFFVRWIWPVLACFIPLLILLVCTVGLLRELRNVFLTRRHTCPGQPVRQTSNRVTFTLAAIFILMLLLASPAEIVKYIDPYASFGVYGPLVAQIANCLQTINFATNFLLYCTVDVTFRQTFVSVIYACHDQRGVNQRLLTRRPDTLSGRTGNSSANTALVSVDRSRRNTRDETELFRSGYRMKKYFEIQ